MIFYGSLDKKCFATERRDWVGEEYTLWAERTMRNPSCETLPTLSNPFLRPTLDNMSDTTPANIVSAARPKNKENLVGIEQ